MTRRIAISLLVLMVPSMTSAQTIETCQPQPDCRIAFSTLKPGAPRSPLNPQDRLDNGLKPDDAHIYNSPGNTLRIPGPPKD